MTATPELGRQAPGATSDRIEFSSEQLPANLDDRRRRNLWRDLYSELYGPLEVAYAEDRPFSARLELARVGSLGLVTCRSTVARFIRTPRCVAAAGSDDFQLAVSLSGAPMQVRQLGREASFDREGVALVSDAQPGHLAAGAGEKWMFVGVPARQLAALVRDVEDLIARPLGRGRPATRYLRRYLDILLSPGGMEDDPSLNQHIETTLVDLVALVLGAGRDGAEIARQRGLRATRLQTILATIKSGYDDPGFSVHALASRVGLSPRYIQDILHDTGTTLTERVLERRLQRARAMLTDRRHAARRVIDIALACGFNEVSYFNRAFRRRFGTSPSEMRTTDGTP